MNDPIDDDFSAIGIPKPSAAAGSTNARPAAALDRGNGPSASKTGVVQPKPQALAKRTGPSSILVSPRQKGNPILSFVKNLPWEYSDTPADYILGSTTCALFLSLKYHRLHPEYIYTRIKGLGGRYLLRIVLVMVDIGNHEESLRELSKTSLINNVTLVLCWSAAEGARYLELFKTYENAPPTAIKQHQSLSYSDRMVDFITTPRSINKTDAVSLVSQFGSIRTAVNARHEDIAAVAGWGDKKVERWCRSVREPFRVQRAARRTLAPEKSIQTQSVARAMTLSREATRAETQTPAHDQDIPQVAIDAVPDNEADQRPYTRLAEEFGADELADGDLDNLIGVPMRPVPEAPAPKKRKNEDDELDAGVMAALSKLRKPD
ncbi:hypothetical protein AMS68_007775 [Peltaster fructicola]|uniref:ERCC1-like central domain-containing protein n=1 Tax=Peltaster fructicola TaxID=286661 RepID=A0A6H0Y5Y8_9PEZI|nr:hypothetical protein AMS68_007775 [Peltaster fructicola]